MRLQRAHARCFELNFSDPAACSAAIHTLGHFLNFYRLSQVSQADLPTLNREFPTLRLMQPASLWHLHFGTVFGVTGWLLLCLLLVLAVSTLPWFRATRFHAFFNLHRLNYLMFGLVFLHGELAGFMCWGLPSMEDGDSAALYSCAGSKNLLAPAQIWFYVAFPVSANPRLAEGIRAHVAFLCAGHHLRAGPRLLCVPAAPPAPHHRHVPQGAGRSAVVPLLMPFLPSAWYHALHC